VTKQPHRAGVINLHNWKLAKEMVRLAGILEHRYPYMNDDQRAHIDALVKRVERRVTNAKFDEWLAAL